MLHQLLRPAIIIFALALPLWIGCRVFIAAYNKKQERPFLFRREFVLFLFYVYIICVLLVTVVPIPMTRSESSKFSRINFIPVIKTLRGFTNTFSPANAFMREHVLENIVGNILLFLPLGIFLPLAFGKFRSKGKVIFTAFLFSFSIELIQFSSRQFGINRTVDIDDIILNTSGAVIGFICFLLVIKYSKPAIPVQSSVTGNRAKDSGT